MAIHGIAAAQQKDSEGHAVIGPSTACGISDPVTQPMDVWQRSFLNRVSRTAYRSHLLLDPAQSVSFSKTRSPPRLVIEHGAPG